MKKTSAKILSILVLLLMFTSVFAGCKKSNNGSLTKVKLDEVTRSIFYAPMYAAVNQGFFKEEGIDLEITTGQGADSTVTYTQVINLKQFLQLSRLKRELNNYKTENCKVQLIGSWTLSPLNIYILILIFSFPSKRINEAQYYTNLMIL